MQQRKVTIWLKIFLAICTIVAKEFHKIMQRPHCGLKKQRNKEMISIKMLLVICTTWAKELHKIM